MRGERGTISVLFVFEQRPPPVTPAANDTIHFRQRKSPGRCGGSHVAALLRRCRYGDSQLRTGAESRLAGGCQEKKKKNKQTEKSTDSTSAAF